MKHLHELLVGYSDPDTLFDGPFPLGKTGLMVRLRYIFFLEAAFFSLGYGQSYRFGWRHFPLTFPSNMETMRQAWQSEIMRVMDKPTTEIKKQILENMTVQLFHNKFQEEMSITFSDKAEEQRLFDLLLDRYSADGYAQFRNKAGFHIDKFEALKKPTPGGNLHDMTKLMFDWFAHAGTVAAGVEIRFVTIGGPQAGRDMAKEFKKMMLNAVRYQRQTL